MNFQARIPKGKSILIFGNRPKFDEYIASLAHSDHDVSITVRVEKTKKKRSLSQNAYYFLVLSDFVRPALINIGWEEEETTAESIHEMFKAMFNYKERLIEATGEIVKQPMSTTAMSTTDHMGYMENIKRWCAQNLDLVIPEPNSQLELETDK
jgi:NinB protein